MPDARRAGGLDVDIGLAQAGFAQGGEQGVVGGVGIGHHGQGLALEVLDRLDVLAGIGSDHGHATGAEHRHGAHRNAVGADHDRGVTDGTAEHGVAGADLFGDIHTTLGGDEGQVQVPGTVVTLFLGNDPRRKGRRVGRRGQQVGDLGWLCLGSERQAKTEGDDRSLRQALQGLEHAYS
ncbi:hypothetical protein D3C81_1585460 [compost metagenome]